MRRSVRERWRVRECGVDGDGILKARREEEVLALIGSGLGDCCYGRRRRFVVWRFGRGMSLMCCGSYVWFCRALE